MYMAEKGHQQMKKEKEKRKDAPGCCSVVRRGKTRRGRRTRARQRVKRGQRDAIETTRGEGGEATGQRRHLKRGQCDAAKATRQRQRDESNASTRRRQQGKGRATMGRRGGGDRMRQGRRVAKATQDEGAGDRREGNRQHLKRKKETTHQASAVSRYAFMSGKGAAS